MIQDNIFNIGSVNFRAWDPGRKIMSKVFNIRHVNRGFYSDKDKEKRIYNLTKCRILIGTGLYVRNNEIFTDYILEWPIWFKPDIDPETSNVLPDAKPVDFINARVVKIANQFTFELPDFRYIMESQDTIDKQGVSIVGHAFQEVSAKV